MARPILIACLVLLSPGCAGTTTQVPAAPTATLLRLQPSPVVRATQAELPARPTPGPSPTPLTHIVQQGETLLGIAFQYGVELDDLLVANAGVNPRFLSVGQAIRIPGPEGQAVLPTATPVPLDLSAVDCHPTLEGGLWCLSQAANQAEDAVEGIVALITLGMASGEPLRSEPAYTPLNLLPAGGRQPLVAYFSPPVAPFEQSQIRLISAVSAADVEVRYAALELQIQQSVPGPKAETWEVSGQVTLLSAANGARQVHLSLVAFDAAGRPVGLAKAVVQAEPRASFLISVSSLGPAIDQVEVSAEAPIPIDATG